MDESIKVTNLGSALFGTLFFSIFTGFAFVLIANSFIAEFRGQMAKDTILVQGTINRILLYCEKHYDDDNKYVYKTNYYLVLKIIYSHKEKTYEYTRSSSSNENGKLFAELKDIIKLSEKLSPNQGITMVNSGNNIFSTAEKEIFSSLEFDPNVKGKYEIKISNSTPDVVVHKQNNGISMSLVSIVLGAVIGIGFLLLMCFLVLRNFHGLKLFALVIAACIGVFGGASASIKWFWKGGKNTIEYDPNNPEYHTGAILSNGRISSEQNP